MKESKVIKSFKIFKIVQLVVVVMFEIAFLLILLLDSTLRNNVYSNRPLFILCAVTWVWAILVMICIILDLQGMKRLVTADQDLHTAAFLDDLTGLPNRYSLDQIFRSYNTEDTLKNTCCCLSTIDNLPELNDTFGRNTGDSMIRVFSAILEETGREFGVVGRNGGNEFIIVINNCTREVIDQFSNKLDEQLAIYNNEHPYTPIIVRNAYALNSEEKKSSFSDLLTVAYGKLLGK